MYRTCCCSPFPSPPPSPFLNIWGCCSLAAKVAAAEDSFRSTMRNEVGYVAATFAASADPTLFSWNTSSGSRCKSQSTYRGVERRKALLGVQNRGREGERQLGETDRGCAFKVREKRATQSVSVLLSLSPPVPLGPRGERRGKGGWGKR